MVPNRDYTFSCLIMRDIVSINNKEENKMMVKVYYDGVFKGVSSFDFDEVLDSLIFVKKLLNLGTVERAYSVDHRDLYIFSK